MTKNLFNKNLATTIPASLPILIDTICKMFGIVLSQDTFNIIISCAIAITGLLAKAIDKND